MTHRKKTNDCRGQNHLSTDVSRDELREISAKRIPSE
jgi:hypothetical protein